MPEPTQVALAVPSDDPKKKDAKEEKIRPGADAKEGEELVRPCFVSWAADLLTCPQSEEDLQLRGELEMLVERLRVCDSFTRFMFCGRNSSVGARYHVIPTSTRDPSNAHPYIYIFNDLRSETPQIPTTTLSRSSDLIRNLVTVRRQGMPLGLDPAWLTPLE